MMYCPFIKVIKSDSNFLLVIGGLHVPTPILSIYPVRTHSGCGKREAHKNLVHGDAKEVSVTGTTLRTTGPVPADSRQ